MGNPLLIRDSNHQATTKEGGETAAAVSNEHRQTQEILIQAVLDELDPPQSATASNEKEKKASTLVRDNMQDVKDREKCRAVDQGEEQPRAAVKPRRDDMKDVKDRERRRAEDQGEDQPVQNGRDSKGNKKDEKSGVVGARAAGAGTGDPAAQKLGHVYSRDQKDSKRGALAATSPSPNPSAGDLNAFMDRTLDILEGIDHLPVSPTPASAARPQSMPGAFAQAGIDRQGIDRQNSTSMFTFYNTSVMLNDDDENDVEEGRQGNSSSSPGPVAIGINANADLSNRDGLVEALPVEPTPLPTEEAEPVDEDEIQRTEDQMENKKRTRRRYFLLGLLLALFLLVGLVVFAVQKATSSSNNSQVTTTASTNTTTGYNHTDIGPPPELPIMALLPNTTQIYLRNQMKINGDSPRYRAYQWMEKDPNIWTFSDDRLLQRFALATFFYATKGETWKERGGGNITLGKFVGASDKLPKCAKALPPAFQGGGPPGGGGGGGPPGGGPPGGGPPGGGPPGGGPPGGGGGPPPWQGGGGGGGGGPPGDGGGGPPPWQGGGGGGGPPGGGGGGPPPGGGGGGGGPPPWSRPPPGGPPQSQIVPSEEWLSYNTHECSWYTTNMAPCVNEKFTVFDMMENNMLGHLPEEIGLLTSLAKLSLRFNGIGYTLPSEFGRLTNLRILIISDNEFVGSIPSQFGLLSDSLQWFVALENKLSGAVPREFWKLSTLTEIKWQGVSGTIPENIGSLLPHMTKFMSAFGGLSGTIPTGLGLWTNLQSLMLNNNALSGTIPTQLGLLTNLDVLFLSENPFLSGTIPSELASLSRMGGLWLHENPRMSGSIPPEFSNLGSFLAELKLEETPITGTIPSELCSSEDDCGPSFECSDLLCGCGCECPAATTPPTNATTAPTNMTSPAPNSTATTPPTNATSQTNMTSPAPNSTVRYLGP